MTATTTTISYKSPMEVDEYKDLRYQIILQLEESGKIHTTPYLDSVGIPTIGVGFNLLIESNVETFIIHVFGEEYRDKAEAVHQAALDLKDSYDAKFNEFINNKLAELPEGATENEKQNTKASWTSEARKFAEAEIRPTVQSKFDEALGITFEVQAGENGAPTVDQKMRAAYVRDKKLRD